MREYRELSAALEVEQRLLAELQAEVADANGGPGNWNRHCANSTARSRTEDGLRHQEGRLADAREQIAGPRVHAQARTARRRAPWKPSCSESAGCGRSSATGRRQWKAESRFAAAEAEQAAEASLTAVQQTADAEAAMLSTAAERVTQLDRVVATNRDQQFELVGDAAAARSTATACLAQVERLQKEYTRERTEVNQAAARRATLAEVLDGLSRADADVQSRLWIRGDRSRKLEEERKGIVDAADRVQRSLESLRASGRPSGPRRGPGGPGPYPRWNRGRRRHVLALLNAAVRRAIPMARIGRLSPSRPTRHSTTWSALSPTCSPYRMTCSAGRGVLWATPPSGSSFVRESRGRGGSLSRRTARPSGVPAACAIGRILDCGPAVSTWVEPSSPETLAGQVTSDVPGLADQLLGNVLLVATAAEARAVQGLHPGYRIVTRAGELFEPDGTLTIGPARRRPDWSRAKANCANGASNFRLLASKSIWL